LSFIDYGGNGLPLLALHGHMNEGRFVQGLAEAIRDNYRVIALDQRGTVNPAGRPASPMTVCRRRIGIAGSFRCKKPWFSATHSAAWSHTDWRSAAPIESLP